MSDLVQLNVVEKPTESQPTNFSSWSDWIGMVASIGCAIHCAAMPFVIASLPALGLSFLADESFHKWMAFLCFVIALAAFVPGWRKHGRLLPAFVGLVGLALISGAAFGLEGECCTACADGSAEVTSVDAAAGEIALTDGGDGDLSAVAYTEAATEELGDEAVCTEHCCEFCDAEATETGADDDAPATTLAGFIPMTATSSALLSRIAPWLTPIGGLILVTAHLLNRRYGCLCGCCEDETSDNLKPALPGSGSA